MCLFSLDCWILLFQKIEIHSENVKTTKSFIPAHSQKIFVWNIFCLLYD